MPYVECSYWQNFKKFMNNACNFIRALSKHRFRKCKIDYIFEYINRTIDEEQHFLDDFTQKSELLLRQDDTKVYVCQSAG